MSEKRHFSRVDFHAKTFIIYKEEKHEAQLLDLSLKGALVSSQHLLLIQMDETISLHIELGNANVALDIEAELVHREKDQMGFRFKTIDLDSLTHLRRLIEINLGDAEKIDKELEFLSHAE